LVLDIHELHSTASTLRAMEDAREVSESYSSEFDYDRTVALSDGVFAIALTLLVLTISFPDLRGGAHARLGDELADRLSQLFSYALSFAVLSLLWLRHHAFFRGLARIDGRIAVLNLLYLALVAFLPYPTRLVGEYGDQAVAVTTYAATITAVVLVANVVRLHASRAGLVRSPSPDTRKPQLVVPAVFLISIPLALLVSPSAAKWSWAVLLLIGPLRQLFRRPGRAASV
jgi:uncharacterized membrane protein